MFNFNPGKTTNYDVVLREVLIDKARYALLLFNQNGCNNVLTDCSASELRKNLVDAVDTLPVDDADQPGKKRGN